MKKLGLLMLCLIYGLPSFGFQIAFSFDDAPMPDGPVFTGEARTEQIIKTLRDKQVKEVVFFANPRSFDEEAKRRLTHYAQAGHIIANHTATHIDLAGKDITVQQFLNNMTQADKDLKTLPNFRRWFRYPYLHQAVYNDKSGNNKKVLDYLISKHYKQGYVTVETYDWHLAALVSSDSALNIPIDHAKLKKIYLEMLWDGITFYDKLSKEILGRSPKHIILLHENDLAALYLGDLIDHIRANGGEIIPISQAYTDAISNSKYDALPFSQRRIRSIARSKGYKGETVSKYEEEKNIEALYRG